MRLYSKPCKTTISFNSFWMRIVFSALLNARSTGAPYLQFWSEARPDWYSLYVQRQHLPPQVGDRLRQGQPQQQAAGQPGSWRPPALSYTRFLHKWDEAAAALQASRIARRQRKEQWLLQQYGGVKPDAAEQQQLMANGAGGCAHGGCRSCDAHV